MGHLGGPGPAGPRRTPGRRARIVVVGSGLRFLSGISVYTHELTRRLAATADVSAVLVRDLVPVALYPGGARVGARLSSLSYAGVPHTHVDWHWRGLPAALHRITRDAPDTLVLQWWTAATGHTYVVLALWARLRGARVVVEFHEVQDPGEAGHRLLRAYGAATARLLVRLADGAVVHHRHDLDLLEQGIGLRGLDVRLAAHPPYDYLAAVTPSTPPELTARTRTGDAPVRFLFFGVIRPRKGFDLAAAAFHALPREVAERAELLVVGECWEGMADPVAEARSGRHGDRVVVVGRYVSDAEAAAVLALADVMLLPYLESSSSGPLALAMAAGMPVLHSDLPGLHAAAAGFRDARAVPVGDVVAWTAAMTAAVTDWPPGAHERAPAGADWSGIIDAYAGLGAVPSPGPSAPPPEPAPESAARSVPGPAPEPATRTDEPSRHTATAAHATSPPATSGSRPP